RGPRAAPGGQKGVAHRGKRRRVTAEADAAEVVVQRVGNDLGARAGELEKRAAVVAGRTSGGGATREDVAAPVGARPGQTLQDLIDAALERRAAPGARPTQPATGQAGMTGWRHPMGVGPRRAAPAPC